MNIREKIKNFIKNPNKILVSTMFSVLTTFLFALYNGYLGIVFNDSWGISISIYYLCLISAKLISVTVENKLKNKNYLNVQQIRRTTYIILSIFMFFIDICLIAPISLMIVNPKNVKFGLIPAIVMAVYTTYKVTTGIINYKKVTKTNNLIFKYVRELSVVDALVSILTLQHTLIMVNGGMTSGMKILSSLSSLGIFLIIVVFSIFQIINTKKNNLKYII